MGGSYRDGVGHAGVGWGGMGLNVNFFSYSHSTFYE